MEGRAYISNLKSGTISVIDLGSRAVTNIDVGSFPVFSCLHPHDHEKLIVSLHNYYHREGEGAIVVVDLWTGDKQKFAYGGPAMPSGMAYDQNADKLYVADENLCQIHVHHGRTLARISSLPAGLAPAHLDISSDGSCMVVANRKSSDLYVYDLLQDPITAAWGIASIHLGPTPGFKIFDKDEGKAVCHPYDVRFSRDSSICYATDYMAGELLVINVLERDVTHHIRVGASPFGMDLNKAGTMAYICNQGDSSVSVVDLGSKEVVGEISGLVGGPSHCALYEEMNQLLVTCQGDEKGGAVQFIDLETERISETVKDEMLKGSIGINVYGTL